MAAEALLSKLSGLLFLGFLLPASFASGVGSLNLEELSEMRYGIEILPLPVMGGQVSKRRAGEGLGLGEVGKKRKKDSCGVCGGSLRRIGKSR